jgi:allophanate hydrolase subunit 2
MIVVDRVLGLATIQDLGRPGRMHEALAPGGALVPELLVAANRSVANPDGAPAIEILGRLAVRAEAPVSLSTGLLRTGDSVAIESEPLRVAYLAIRGGFAAPPILGSASTQLSAGLGSPLRAGDRLATAAAPEVESAPPPAITQDPIAIVPGPDAGAFAPDAIERLVAGPYRVLPSSDRIGTRLDGAAIPRSAGHVETSRPMVRGAIEIPSDGQPIVLGPEHPTTGGYPIVAVIAHRDLGRFFAIRLGGSVRFAY